MAIILTLEEWEVLQDVLVKAGVAAPPTSPVGIADQLALDADEQLADDYRNLLQDEFDVRGMDENYEPTSRGRVMESLIDKLFTA